VYRNDKIDEPWQVIQILLPSLSWNLASLRLFFALSVPAREVVAATSRSLPSSMGFYPSTLSWQGLEAVAAAGVSASTLFRNKA
jgi:hypothetical protein